MEKVTVVGNTSWGNTIAALLGRTGLEARLLTRSEEETLLLQSSGLGYSPTHRVQEALEGARFVVWAVPSQTMRANATRLRGVLGPDVCHVSAAKGLEVESGKRMTQVLEAVLGDGP
ncbi:MAG: glycerol-3-phosphate dehydrogenase, partial [Chloroflexi bacterium]|nr:glycerol-3-phosphate dehydrogenase [Chloroflexota bacterium]